MRTLASPSQYVKAIVAFLVAGIGAVVTGGVVSGTAALVLGAIGTGLVSFGAVFIAPNKQPEPASTVTVERVNPSAD